MPSYNLTTELINRSNVQILRMIRAERFIGQKVQELLNELELDLLRKLEQIAGKDALTAGRLKTLLVQTRNLIEGTYKRIDRNTVKDFGDIAKAASYEVANMVNLTTGTDLISVLMTDNQLESLATQTMVMGRYMEEWWGKQSTDLFQKFTMQMRVGMLQGESIAELTQRVRGTRANNFTDGLFNMPTHQAEALVRTGTISMANMGRLQTMVDNKDVLNGIQWVATLDDRTCEICMALDGLAWELPSGDDAQKYGDYEGFSFGKAQTDKQFPGPTAHISCRCTQVPVVKSYKELAGQTSEVDSSTVPAEKRASMDGQTGETTGFDEWLSGKDHAFQDDLLGDETAKLFREGKIDLKDLTSNMNVPLSPDQLKLSLGIPPETPKLGAYWTDWKGITDKGAVNAFDTVFSESQPYVNALAKYRAAQAGYPIDIGASRYHTPTFDNASIVAGSELDKARIEAKNAFAEYQATGLPKIHEALAVENPSTNLPTIDVSSARSTDLDSLTIATNQAVENFRSITAPELFDQMKEVNVDGVLSLREGATANYDFTSNTIHVVTDPAKRSGKALEQSVMHEMTHELQYTTGNWKKELAFYEMRGGRNFNWFDSYMSRSYPYGTAEQVANFPHPFGNWSAREVMTTAMEYYWYQPHELALRDPQLFEFVYKLLHNTL